MFKNFLCNFCCSDEKVEVELQIELIKINEESQLNEAQKEFDVNSISLEDKNEFLYLNETYLYHFKIYIELNKGSIQNQNDFLYIIPEKAPLPHFFNKINRNYLIPLCNKKTSNSMGYAEYSLKNLSINEPYIIYYLRRIDSTLETKSLFASKSFKMIYRLNNAFVSKIKNMELYLVYEDEPDFFKQNLETSTKIISAWNTPHRRIDSIKSFYSNTILKNEKFETKNNSNELSTLRKNTPHNSNSFIPNYGSFPITEFKLNEEKDSKFHQRNLSIFTASKSTCSSSGDSYLGGILENKLNQSKNLLHKNVFDTQNKNSSFHHKNSLSMNTPNNKKIFKQCPATFYEKRDNDNQLNYLIKDSLYDEQLFSYKALKNGKTSNRSLNNENFLKLRRKGQKINDLEKNENIHLRTKTSVFQSYFKTHLSPNDLKKESPDQSFFLNVNELSFTEIHPKKRIEDKNISSNIHYHETSQLDSKNLAKFINLPIDNKTKEVKEQGNYQTPQSKKRLYTVEEVFSISNDSSSINDTNCFKFSNTNSANKNVSLMKLNKGEKIKNITNVVEEDEEISLNHITANEISSSQEDKLIYERTLNFDENSSNYPAFLKSKENKLHFAKIWENFNQKFKEIGFYFKLDFTSNIIIIYQIKSWQIYQIYKFLEFKKLADINAFFEDIYASVKFALL